MGIDQHIQHIAGDNRGQVLLYALSTCGWCRKTRNLLDELGVEYDYVYVDQLEGEPKREALDRVRAWNPNTTFPTLVIDGEALIGFQEDGMRRALRGGHG
jgi:glutaredoxin